MPDREDERVVRAALSALANPDQYPRLRGAHADDAHQMLHALTRDTTTTVADPLTLGRDLIDRAGACGIRQLIPTDPGWPALPSYLPAPPCLWLAGADHHIPPGAHAVAVLGARAASAYGQHLATEFGRGLAEGDITVIATGGLGIDAHALRGALTSTSGVPIAIVASGLDLPYPHQHRRAFDQIRERGITISACPPGTALSRRHALYATALAIGLADLSVVVETARASTLVAAARTAHLGARAITAVPGPVTSTMSAGCHELIATGVATLVSDVTDIITILTTHTSTKD